MKPAIDIQEIERRRQVAIDTISRAIAEKEYSVDPPPGIEALPYELKVRVDFQSGCSLWFARLSLPRYYYVVEGDGNRILAWNGPMRERGMIAHKDAANLEEMTRRSANIVEQYRKDVRTQRDVDNPDRKIKSEYDDDLTDLLEPRED